MPITKKDVDQYAIFEQAINYLGDRASDRADASHHIAQLESIYQDGFDVNKMYFGGAFNNTPLLWEISYGKAVKPDAVLMMLRILKADPFISDKYGKNALHFLLLKGYAVQRCIVDEILTRADVTEHINDQAMKGDTPLHIACARRDEDLIVQLIEKGADLNIKNQDGKTPADMLHLTEEEAKNFISSYLGFDDSLEYVATIDNSVFTLNPEAIEKRMREEALKHPLPPQPQPRNSINKKIVQNALISLESYIEKYEERKIGTKFMKFFKKDELKMAKNLYNELLILQESSKDSKELLEGAKQALDKATKLYNEKSKSHDNKILTDLYNILYDKKGDKSPTLKTR